MTFLRVGTEAARSSPPDRRCSADIPSYGSHRNWAAAGSMRSTVIENRHVPIARREVVVVWQRRDRHVVEAPPELDGAVGPEGFPFDAFAIGARPFGFRLIPLDGEGRKLCGLSLTIPLREGNVSFWWRLAEVTPLLSLEVDESARSLTTGGERFAITRPNARKWAFEVAGDGRAHQYLDRAVLAIEASDDSWQGFDIDITLDSLLYEAEGRLRADRRAARR